MLHLTKAQIYSMAIIYNNNLNININISDINEHQIAHREKQRKAVINAILNNDKIEYYTNFIIINNKTYNGWNKQQVEELKNQLLVQR